MAPDPITSIYIDDEEVQLPTKWGICNVCEGHGSVSRIPGAFTSVDLDEWYGDSAEREEFLAEYMKRGGAYDRPCGRCGGSGKHLVVDEEKLDPIMLKLYHDQQVEIWADWAAEEQERAMGA
jgi:hypothetical protein